MTFSCPQILPKNQTNEFVVVIKTNSFVRFLGEFEDTKSPFEIIWPLGGLKNSIKHVAKLSFRWRGVFKEKRWTATRNCWKLNRARLTVESQRKFANTFAEMSFASLKQAFSLLMIKFTQIQYWTNVGWLVWWFQANSAIPIVLMSSFAKVLQENLLVLKVNKPINWFK